MAPSTHTAGNRFSALVIWQNDTNFTRAKVGIYRITYPRMTGKNFVDVDIGDAGYSSPARPRAGPNTFWAEKNWFAKSPMMSGAAIAEGLRQI